MKHDAIQDWRDVLLRREPKAEETEALAAWLRDHPEAAAEWETEVRLARALRQLRDVPVASNFTSRVLAEVAREAAKPSLATPWWRTVWTTRWMPAAAATLVAVVAVGGWEIHRARRAAEFTRQVATLRAMSGLPPAVLEDFEAIRRYSESTPPVDFNLLAALQ